jgi:hypothetical protein
MVHDGVDWRYVRTIFSIAELTMKWETARKQRYAAVYVVLLLATAVAISCWVLVVRGGKGSATLVVQVLAVLLLGTAPVLLLLQTILWQPPPATTSSHTDTSDIAVVIVCHGRHAAVDVIVGTCEGA